MSLISIPLRQLNITVLTIGHRSTLQKVSQKNCVDKQFYGVVHLSKSLIMYDFVEYAECMVASKFVFIVPGHG